MFVLEPLELATTPFSASVVVVVLVSVLLYGDAKASLFSTVLLYVRLFFSWGFFSFFLNAAVTFRQKG